MASDSKTQRAVLPKSSVRKSCIVICPSLLRTIWEKACKESKALNVEREPEITVVDTGDHAVNWRLGYKLKNLYQILQRLDGTVKPLFEKRDYRKALFELAKLRESVDQFFDDVMVMVDNDALKNNRLALLQNLRSLFLQVADLSRLQS